MILSFFCRVAVKPMSLNTTQIYNAFISGANSLISQRQILNDLNVFPVADGDTGSNMASTMEGILRHSRYSDSMAETMNSIVDAVSMNAKGNSGAILAQFIIGFSEQLPDRDLTESDFIIGLKVAVAKVYAALSHPVEGTMITVMRLWVDEIESLYQKTNDFNKSLDISMTKANEVLKDTPNLLQILKDHHVVDSGAKGFVSFLEGFINGLWTTEKMIVPEAVEFDEDDSHVIEADELITHRYCTEALIQSDTQDTEYLKSLLEPYGDSLLIVKSKRYIKIHIHTNAPDRVMNALKSLGPIIQQKADDMILQHADFTPKAKIGLITDSIADLPRSFIDEAQVHVYPLTILIDEAPYLDRITMPARQFYDQLSTFKKYPSSSQPPLKSVEELYKRLLHHYEQLLVVSVSSGMSGTHAVFEEASKSFKDKVFVVDTKQNSGAQGLLVLLANRLIQEGLLASDIKKQVEEASKNTKIFVSVDTLKYMVKMGRIPPVVGKIGQWVNMKPIVTIDEHGHGKTLSPAFSKKQTEKKILKEIEYLIQEKELVNYCIVHGNDLDRAQRFAALLSDKLNQKPEYIEEVSSIVAMSAGPKTFAIALQLKEKS